MDRKRAEAETLRESLPFRDGKRKKIQCRVRRGHSRSKLGIDPEDNSSNLGRR